MAIPSDILDQVQGAQQLNISAIRPLGGGCIHQAHKIETDQGSFFLKYNDLSVLSNFQAEQKGLSILGEFSEFQIPRVLHCSSTSTYAFLMLAFIESGPRAGDYWEVFGRRLAHMHKQSQDNFGLDHDNFIGALPQSNHMHADWISFYVHERIEPMLRMAIDTGKMQAGIRKDFEQLYKKLPDIFPQESPALLHGDLWGGNILADEKGHATIFDPAVYYGHREMELAFMRLFDSQPQAFYEAYQEVYPLAPGFRDRFDLCNLYPLLVHVNLFGGGYVGSVQRILRNL